MFREVLADMVAKADGALGAVVMGSDGIAVEQVVVDAAGFDLEVVAMELSVILREVVRVMVQIEAGRTEELLVRSAGITAIVRILTDDYFVALAIRPGASLGKGRYALRRATPKLLDGL